jgi:hypothetical protein
MRIVWVTMLAMADENGIVSASVDGLARRAVVTIDECEKALAAFMGPDHRSRDDTTGERIEKVPGGWLILNHANYRERQTRQQVLTAARVARHRAKKSCSVTAPNVTPVTPYLPLSPSEAEADAEADAESSPSGKQLGSQSGVRCAVETDHGDSTKQYPVSDTVERLSKAKKVPK